MNRLLTYVNNCYYGCTLTVGMRVDKSINVRFIIDYPVFDHLSLSNLVVGRSSSCGPVLGGTD